MAYTNTLIRQTVMGNQRVLEYNVTVDAASGVVYTGLNYVDSVQFAPISMTSTGLPRLKANVGTASAASLGNVFISSAVSGDNFFLTIYGR